MEPENNLNENYLSRQALFKKKKKRRRLTIQVSLNRRESVPPRRSLEEVACFVPRRL